MVNVICLFQFNGHPSVENYFKITYSVCFKFNIVFLTLVLCIDFDTFIYIYMIAEYRQTFVTNGVKKNC